MLLKIEKLKGARFSRTGLKSPEGEVLQWERTDRVLSCSPGRKPVLQPLWVSRMLYKNINHFKMLRCCFTGFIEPARPSYHAHILLVCETLYPAGKTRTRLKASLCQYFLLCDPNFIHKTICKSSAPMNCGNVEIVQISHHYSATRIHFSFFR